MKRGAASPKEAIRAALEALERQFRETVAEIERGLDDQQAFGQLTELAQKLRALFDEASELRAKRVKRIWETEELSLAQLANRISVSRARADQLLRIAKKKAAEEGQT